MIGLLLGWRSKFCERALGLFCKEKCCSWHIDVFTRESWCHCRKETQGLKRGEDEGTWLWHSKRKGFPRERVMLQEGCLCILYSATFEGKAQKASGLTNTGPQENKQWRQFEDAYKHKGHAVLYWARRPGGTNHIHTHQIRVWLPRRSKGRNLEGNSSKRLFSQPCQVWDLAMQQKLSILFFLHTIPSSTSNSSSEFSPNLGTFLSICQASHWRRTSQEDAEEQNSHCSSNLYPYHAFSSSH